MNKRASAFAFIMAFSLLPQFASAVPFTNGDFSSGLTGWNDASSTGTVSVVGGAAHLETGAGADPFSAVLVQGDDGFFFFTPPLSLGISDNYLIFDVDFLDLGADGSEGAPYFDTDNLAVLVYDALDFNLDLLFGAVADTTTPSQQIVLDVSSLAGRDVALSFELTDANDGRDSRAIIDNVYFSDAAPTSMPEPSTLILLGSGLLLTFRKRYGNKAA